MREAIGVDLYNQCTTGKVAKTLNAIKSDADHVPCVLIVENEDANELGWHTDSTDIDSEQCRWKSEDAGQGKLQCDYRGY